jgi:hypothetical protein
LPEHGAVGVGTPPVEGVEDGHAIGPADHCLAIQGKRPRPQLCGSSPRAHSYGEGVKSFEPPIKQDSRTEKLILK